MFNSPVTKILYLELKDFTTATKIAHLNNPDVDKSRLFCFANLKDEIKIEVRKYDVAIANIQGRFNHWSRYVIKSRW